MTTCAASERSLGRSSGCVAGYAGYAARTKSSQVREPAAGLVVATACVAGADVGAVVIGRDAAVGALRSRPARHNAIAAATMMIARATAARRIASILSLSMRA